jgi:biotin carboxyl carrier protein
VRWKIKLEEQSEPIEVTLLAVENDRYRFRVGMEEVEIENPKVYPFSLEANNLLVSFEAWTSRKWRIVHGAETFTFEPIAWESSGSVAAKEIRSDMPGRILKVLVKPGEKISSNQSLLIIEAMKMENEIRAQGESVVKSIAVQPGQSIESGALLIEFEPAS